MSQSVKRLLIIILGVTTRLPVMPVTLFLMVLVAGTVLPAATQTTEGFNFPVFDQEEYTFRIDESDEFSPLVGTVRATDIDGDTITYSIVASQDSSFFFLTVESGVATIRGTRPFDADGAFSSFSISIEASDGVLQSTAIVDVRINDINDNAPQFQQNVYVQTLAENTPVDTNVVTVGATDADRSSNTNGRVTYALLDGNTDSTFRINRFTGNVLLNKALDFETAQLFVVTVRARDLGNPSQESNATIRVTVTDVNDNSPTFQQTLFEVSLPEDSQSGASVVDAPATDPDSGMYDHVV